jgi:hypothetical protein
MKKERVVWTELTVNLSEEFKYKLQMRQMIIEFKITYIVLTIIVVVVILIFQYFIWEMYTFIANNWNMGRKEWRLVQMLRSVGLVICSTLAQMELRELLRQKQQ